MPPLHPWLSLPPNESNDGMAIGHQTSPEMSCDWLFAASAQAVLIVDADTGLMLRANPAASLLLCLPTTALVGAEFPSIFADASKGELQRGFSEAKTSGFAAACMTRDRSGGPPLSVQLSLVRSVHGIYVLARLESCRAAAAYSPRLNAESAVMEAIDAAQFGFLIAAADFHVDYANRAFAKMIDAHSPGDVRGSSILRWLRFSAADLSRLSVRLSQRRAADLLTTVLYPNHGLPQKVEVCAVPVPDGLNTQWGLTVRQLPRLN
ncbi:MAG: PAS domain-containing protein [Pseudomonadota bacterium]|nr:PAS domain-containing protein [Pseudomonadota bacterium]